MVESGLFTVVLGYSSAAAELPWHSISESCWSHDTVLLRWLDFCLDQLSDEIALSSGGCWGWNVNADHGSVVSLLCSEWGTVKEGAGNSALLLPLWLGTVLLPKLPLLLEEWADILSPCRLHPLPGAGREWDTPYLHLLTFPSAGKGGRITPRSDV